MFFKLDTKTNGIFSNAVCGKFPPGEIVIRSAYCNFNCIPCFAAGYSHIKKIEKRKINDIVEIKDFNELVIDFEKIIRNENVKKIISDCNPPEFNWLRILGGEPILNADNLAFLLKFLMGVNKYTDTFGKRVIIQTNGLFLGSQKYEDIETTFNLVDGFDGKIVFEISLKGGNGKEFSITSKRKEEDYSLIFNCIEHFKKISKKFSNVDFVAIAGFGPNKRFLQGIETGGKITLYNPIKKQPFYHSANWDDNFKRLYLLITNKYKKFNGKMPMEGLEDRSDWKWGPLAIEKAKQEIPQNMYNSYSDNIDEKIELEMDDLKEHFFVIDPLEYYPSLFL